MPALPFEAKDVVPAAEMTMTKMVSPPGEQASESYRVRADGNHVLGSGGETRAFGKLNLDPRRDDQAVVAAVGGASSPLFHNAQEMNVDFAMGGDRNLLTRAVASSELDRHMGLNILAEEKFGRNDQGRLMGISVQVDGAGVNSKFEVERNGEQVEMKGFLGLRPADIGRAASPALQNAGIPEHLQGYAHPNIQKGLSDLEVMDYISGQIDRHPGNIFIDPQTAQVKGIDNDLAFPEQSRSAALATDVSLRQKMIATMPMTMHQDTAAKIAAVDPEGMRRMLENVTRPDNAPGLSAEEIDGAVNRLQELQAAIAHPESVPGFQVVAEFNDQTFINAVEAQKAGYQQQQDAIALKYGDAPGQKTFDNITEADLFDAHRTSYAGAILMAEKQKSLEIMRNPAVDTIRPANTVGQAARNPQYAEFAKMVKATEESFKANPQLIQDAGTRQHAINLKEQIAETKAKIAHYNKESAGLENRKMGSMLRSLASGGVEGRKEFYAEKKTAALQQLAALERQLNQTVANAIPDNLRQGLHADAGQIVQARAQQNNAAVAQQQPNLAFLNHPAPQPPGPVPQNVVAQQQPGLAFLNQPAPQPPGPVAQNVVANLPNAGNLRQAEDELNIPAVDEDDDLAVDAEEQEVQAELGVDGQNAEVKQDGLKKSPSVGDMLRRNSNAPAVGQGVEGPKPGGNSLRSSWQSAKPSGSAPKPGGALSASH